MWNDDVLLCVGNEHEGKPAFGTIHFADREACAVDGDVTVDVCVCVCVCVVLVSVCVDEYD